MGKKLGELIGRQILRPEGWVDRELGEHIGIKSGLRETLAKRFSPRGEYLVDESPERGRVGAETIVAAHAYQGGFDFRRGPERLRWQRAQQLDAREHLRH